ncbi:MAG: TetR/AcrR family transcriptional regulator [Myxococcales bacterium]|nr:TetR/AcrR family transcriptional regulator [Myxococcales bacterium]
MEALIQATEKILEEEGPQAVTTIRIASRAGVSIGTLYQCFRNKDAIIKAAMDRRQQAAAKRSAPPPPPPPTPPREALEPALGAVVRRLVAAYAQSLSSMSDLPKDDRDAIHRVELRRMAESSKEILARHGVSDPAQSAHVMTLSCNKVIKDALRHAPESFSDGRLEQALCKLCMDFIRVELQSQ